VVEVLAAVGEVHAEHLAVPARAGQDALDLGPGQVSAEGHRQGADLGVALDLGALNREVGDSSSPVLQRHVANLGVGAGEDLHGGNRKRGLQVRRNVPVYEGQGGAFLHHQDGVREHRGARRVQVCQGLERQLDLDASRHVNQGPARPERGVQGGELRAIRRDQRVDPTGDQVGVVVQGRVEAPEPNPSLLELGVEMRDRGLRVVLDQEAAAVADLARGLEDALFHLVQVRRGLPGGERSERGEIERGQIGVTPFLRLLRRDGQGLERSERFRPLGHQAVHR
jgi:hypothetical protein